MPVKTGPFRKVHGVSQREFQSTYNSWNMMMQRCKNPGCRAFGRYGGAGILPCKAIAADPRALIASIGLKPDDERSLDRPNNKGGYWCGECEECKRNGWPKNLRWATEAEQNRNRNDRKSYAAFGRTQMLIDWSREFGIEMKTLWRRVGKQGLSMEEALVKPLRKSRKGTPLRRKG